MNFYEYIKKENLLELITFQSDLLEKERIDIRYKGIRQAISIASGDRYMEAKVFPCYIYMGDAMPYPALLVALPVEEDFVVTAIGLYGRGQEDVKDINKLTRDEIEYLLDMIKEDEYYFPIS